MEPDLSCILFNFHLFQLFTRQIGVTGHLPVLKLNVTLKVQTSSEVCGVYSEVEYRMKMPVMTHPHFLVKFY